MVARYFVVGGDVWGFPVVQKDIIGGCDIAALRNRIITTGNCRICMLQMDLAPKSLSSIMA
tara:strand:- start:3203 stop:3385 length:183 start_codon:yes stop_codon:yes gene_type:complete